MTAFVAIENTPSVRLSAQVIEYQKKIVPDEIDTSDTSRDIHPLKKKQSKTI